MKILLASVAALVLLCGSPVGAEEDAAIAAERAQLKEQAQRLLEQGSVDYERLQKARAVVEDEKAAMGATGSLAQRDQLARRAQALDAQMMELKKARSRLEDAKNRVLTGRMDAARVAFNDAVERWSQVHQRVVEYLGEAPATASPRPGPVTTGAGHAEIAELRKEVRALRAEVETLRAEIRELRALMKESGR